MNDEDRFAAIEEFLDRVSEMSDTHVLVVEGNKDTRSLRSLGVDSQIVEVNGNGGALRTAENVSRLKKKAVILTDWDRKGDEIAEKLVAQFGALRVDCDTSLRERLRSVCAKDIKDVESLDTLYGRLAEITGHSQMRIGCAHLYNKN